MVSITPVVSGLRESLSIPDRQVNVSICGVTHRGDILRREGVLDEEGTVLLDRLDQINGFDGMDSLMNIMEKLVLSPQAFRTPSNIFGTMR